MISSIHSPKRPVSRLDSLFFFACGILRFADWRSIRNGAQAAQARNLEVIGGGGKKGKAGSCNSTEKG